MGLYDRIHMADGVELPGFPGDPSEVEWQSKHLSKLLNTYRITADGRLERLEQEHVEEQLDDEEPDNYDEAFGNFRRNSKVVDEEWVDDERHGTFTFYATVDDTRWRYEARFTDGDLDKFVLLDPRGD